MSEIVLKVDGVLHGGWTQISVQRSLDMIADAFELTLTDRWSEDTKPRPIKLGAACEIVIDGELVVSGYVEDVTPAYDAQRHSITVAGRSKLGDLVDSMLAAKEYNQRSLKQIAEDILLPFKINFVVADAVQAELDTKYSLKRINAGDSAFELLNNLCQRRAVRMVSNEKGELVFTRAGTQRINTALTLGDNILSASGEFSQRERFAIYTVNGQTESSGLTAVSGSSSASVADKNIKRHRPFVNMMDGNMNIADCKKLAQWECNTRFGRGESVVYTVLGWRHADGLWSINNLVPVNDAFMDINEDRLITEVRFLMDDTGQRTELRVMPKAAYDLLALPDETDDAEGGSL